MVPISIIHHNSLQDAVEVSLTNHRPLVPVFSLAHVGPTWEWDSQKAFMWLQAPGTTYTMPSYHALNFAWGEH